MGKHDKTCFVIHLYWSEEDRAFLAEVPELPGCMADGQSYQEALANAEAMILDWIETAREEGRTIPTPKNRMAYV